MKGKNVLLLLGGMFHDFQGFEAALRPVLEGAGHSLNATYDLDDLLQLSGSDYDAVMSYTSLSAHRDGLPKNTPEALTAAQTDSLVAWVRGGGGFLGIHSATVMGTPNPPLQALLGARFREHPPQFVFAVCPMAGEHPITSGVEAFCVKDELYIHEFDRSVDVHMVAVDRGVAHPMVWSKREGQGRVACISMGHGEAVWAMPQYHRLILQALDWVTQG